MAGRSTRLVKGADLKVYINNRVLGIITELSWQATSGRHAIYGIDDPEPAEIAEGQNAVSGTMGVIRLRLDGGLEGYGVVAQPTKFVLEKYITICVVERFTDRVVFQTDRALVKSQSWSTNPRGLLVGSFTFDAIGWVNEF